MHHATSAQDVQFLHAFEAFKVAAPDFDHTAHLRLAYIYLCQSSPQEAATRMKESLLAFLAHLGVGESKYHETVTRAWIMAVRHFMESSQPAAASQEFISANPRLLDSRIMLKHYSAEVLFSQEARASFVEPDLAAIPAHA